MPFTLGVFLVSWSLGGKKRQVLSKKFAFAKKPKAKG
jgi:hypothetical protein